jgi:hypothetical protein
MSLFPSIGQDFCKLELDAVAAIVEKCDLKLTIAVVDLKKIISLKH